MRIISGSRNGLNISVPAGLPVRPTTDRAKESIFNILETQYDLEGMCVLDLFSGTGSMAFEFASRGAATICCVDSDVKCVKHLKDTQRKFEFENVEIIKYDVFKFLKKTDIGYDLIFADPPYEYQFHAEIAQIVFDRKLLNENGLLIIEHGRHTKLTELPNFELVRTYGNVYFSFFRLDA